MLKKLSWGLAALSAVLLNAGVFSIDPPPLTDVSIPEINSTLGEEKKHFHRSK